MMTNSSVPISISDFGYILLFFLRVLLIFTPPSPLHPLPSLLNPSHPLLLTLFSLSSSICFPSFLPLLFSSSSSFIISIRRQTYCRVAQLKNITLSTTLPQVQICLKSLLCSATEILGRVIYASCLQFLSARSLLKPFQLGRQ